MYFYLLLIIFENNINILLRRRIINLPLEYYNIMYQIVCYLEKILDAMLLFTSLQPC